MLHAVARGVHASALRLLALARRGSLQAGLPELRPGAGGRRVGAERGGDPLKFLTSSGLIRKLKSRFGPKSICANLLGLNFGWRFVCRLML